jgi:O-antigen/teichoic acid export membrane protein
MAGRLTKSVAANQLGFVVSAVCAFILSPVTVAYLGDQMYGVWSLMMSFSGHYGLLTFGLQNAMSRFFTFSLAQGDMEKVSGYYNTAQLMLILSALMAVCLGLLLAGFIDRLFVMPPEGLGQIRWTCIVVALTAGATFLMAPFNGMLVGGKRFGLVNVIGIGITVIRTVCAYVMLVKGYGILHLALLHLSMTLIAGICQMGLVRSIYKGLRVGMAYVQKSCFQELIRFGSKSFVINIAVLLVYQCDLFVLGVFLPPENITIYSLGLTLITYYIQLVNAGVGVLTPFMVSSYAKDGKGGIRGVFHPMSALLLMLSAIVFSGCMVYGEDFYTLWIGPGYTESAAMMALLMVPQFFAAGARISGSTLIALDHIGPMAKLAMAEGLCNLVLSVILVPVMGLTGVALGTVIPGVVNNLVVMPLIAGRQLNFSWLAYLKRSLVPGLLMVLAGLGLGMASVRLIAPDTWPGFVLSVTLTAAGCLVLMVALLRLFKIEVKEILGRLA